MPASIHTDCPRIAFTGAHSTGKSTLLYFIEERFPDLEIEIIAEIARGVIGRGFPLGDQATVDSYVNYIRDQLRAEREAEARRPRLIASDRTLLDIVAYANVNRRYKTPMVPEFFVEMLYELWLRERRYYDMYVYFPIEFDLVEDDVRPTDAQYRVDVSEEIFKLLDTNDVDFVSVSGSLEERFANLSSRLKKLSVYDFSNT